MNMVSIMSIMLFEYRYIVFFLKQVNEKKLHPKLNHNE